MLFGNANPFIVDNEGISPIIMALKLEKFTSAAALYNPSVKINQQTDDYLQQVRLMIKFDEHF
jgi:hypothetical protein